MGKRLSTGVQAEVSLCTSGTRRRRVEGGETRSVGGRKGQGWSPPAAMTQRGALKSKGFLKQNVASQSFQ